MDIMARVNKHYECAVAHYGDDAVLGVFLYGSQNYGTNTENSDVDTKCILIPDLFSLAVKSYEVKHLSVDGEVCECMPIMHMVSNWKKQNINFVEILFTDYCIINPKYKKLWNLLLNEQNRELIARYDTKAAVLSMSYQAIHTMKQDPTDPKKVMNAARIMQSLLKLVDEKKHSYKEIIKAPIEVAKIRTGETPIPEGFCAGMEVVFRSMIEQAEAGAYSTDKLDRKYIDLFLNDLILDLISRRLELGE